MESENQRVLQFRENKSDKNEKVKNKRFRSHKTLALRCFRECFAALKSEQMITKSDVNHKTRPVNEEIIVQEEAVEIKSWQTLINLVSYCNTTILAKVA